MTPGFLFLSANAPWVSRLADAMAEHRPTTAMRFYDLLTWRRFRPKWSEPRAPGLRRVLRVLPPGYAGRLEPLFRPLLRAMIRGEIARLRRRAGGADPFVVVPYPYLAPWVEGVADDRLIYHCVDEYTLYDPARTETIRAHEDRLVARARLTTCTAQFQVDALRRRHPQRARDIVHLPNGVDARFLNPDPTRAPVPSTVGYVGNMVDRVDWALVCAVARLAPDLAFDFTGPLDPADDTLAWVRDRARALALPNVRLHAPVAQAAVADVYRRSAVNWMPYVVDDAFNRASCPTKIMDALASGRPFVGTALPECLLYPDFVHVADDAARLADLLKRLTTTPEPDPVATRDFAATQRWEDRAAALLRFVGDRAAAR